MGKLYNTDFGEVASTLSMLTELGYTSEDFTVLRRPGGREVAEKLLSVIRGQAKVEMIKYLVDCTADPVIPDGWEVVNHDTSLGQLELDISKVELYLSKHQQGDKSIEGNKLRQELDKLKNQTVLNANVLDFLLKHPELIPDEWKYRDKDMFFLGTVYCLSDGGLFVRSLRWAAGRWRCGCGWLDRDWNSNYPATVLVS